MHHGGNDAAAKETVELIEDAGGHAFPVFARFSEDGAVERLAEAVGKALAPTLANELGHRGITVDTVAPGPIRTDLTEQLLTIPEAAAGLTAMTALGRIGEPEDVADVVGFLAGPDGRWVTGRTLDVSGGTYLGPIG